MDYKEINYYIIFILFFYSHVFIICYSNYYKTPCNEKNLNQYYEFWGAWIATFIFAITEAVLMHPCLKQFKKDWQLFPGQITIMFTLLCSIALTCYAISDELNSICILANSLLFSLIYYWIQNPYQFFKICSNNASGFQDVLRKYFNLNDWLERKRREYDLAEEGREDLFRRVWILEGEVAYSKKEMADYKSKTDKKIADLERQIQAHGQPQSFDYGTFSAGQQNIWRRHSIAEQFAHHSPLSSVEISSSLSHSQQQSHERFFMTPRQRMRTNEATNSYCILI